ncbi:unnamed protein product [Dicrocoelium dendriticum]|nr:unnamed protein product [Dicrocoelium dendriticum]
MLSFLLGTRITANQPSRPKQLSYLCVEIYISVAPFGPISLYSSVLLCWLIGYLVESMRMVYGRMRPLSDSNKSVHLKWTIPCAKLTSAEDPSRG